MSAPQQPLPRNRLGEVTFIVAVIGAVFAARRCALPHRDYPGDCILPTGPQGHCRQPPPIRRCARTGARILHRGRGPLTISADQHYRRRYHAAFNSSQHTRAAAIISGHHSPAGARTYACARHCACVRTCACGITGTRASTRNSTCPTPHSGTRPCPNPRRGASPRHCCGARFSCGAPEYGLVVRRGDPLHQFQWQLCAAACPGGHASSRSHSKVCRQHLQFKPASPGHLLQTRGRSTVAMTSIH
jgi:hypothetical protein